MSNIISQIKDFRYKRKHRREIAEKMQAELCGFSIATKETTFSGDQLLLRSFVNMLLMFTLIFGLALSFIIPFEIEANQSILAVAFLILSAFFSFINTKKSRQNIGYILFFVGFTAFLIVFRSFINSGLNGMLNDFFTSISDMLDFSRIKTYNEEFESQHLMTVTVFFVVIGAVFMLLVNFTFNNEQSPFTILFIIFPFLQMAMYVDEFAGMPSFFLIVFSIICCLVFRYNFQHRIPIKGKNSFYFSRKKDIYQLQTSSGIVALQVTGYVATILLIFTLIFSVLVPSEKFRPTVDDLALKENTKPTVTKILMYGLSSLFYGNKTTWDDAMGGQLGQVGTVYQDFEDDLYVTFTPYQYSTVYLREKTYSAYYNTHWERTILDEKSKAANDFSETIDYLSDLSETDKTILKGKMRTEIVDFSLLGTLEMPYYGTIISDDGILVSSSRVKNLEYYVFQDFWESDKAKNISYDNLSKQYELFALPLYASAENPTRGEVIKGYQLQETLNTICEEQGFSGSPTEIISQIQEYLKNDFVYTLNPGTIPNGEDFVSYFLTESKKGYCTYFATAGCLLLRSMGIPARYAEGYALDMSAVIGGDILDTENYEDWITGESKIGKTAVVKAALTDANAHAWCEVYVDGFGWVPVEFTVAGTMDESDKDAWNIWNPFGNASADDNANDVLAAIFGADLGSVFNWIGKLLLIVVILLIPFVGYRIYKKLMANKRSDRIVYPQNNKQLMKQYQAFVKWLKKHNYINEENPTASSVCKSISQISSKEAASIIFALYNKAAYSPNEISHSELDQFKNTIKTIKK